MRMYVIALLVSSCNSDRCIPNCPLFHPILSARCLVLCSIRPCRVHHQTDLMPLTNLSFCRIGKLTWLYPLLFIFLLAFLRPAHPFQRMQPAVRTTWDSLADKIRERDSLDSVLIGKLKKSLQAPWVEQITKEGRLQQVIDSQKFLIEQEAGLQQVLARLDQLKNSRNATYGVVLLTDTMQISETIYDPVSQSIVFKVFGAETFVHESTHGFQFEHKGLAYDRHGGGSIGCDIQDEIDAYKAEYYYDPDAVARLHSTVPITSLGSISKKWLTNLVSAHGMIYACAGWAYTAQISVDVHSSPRRLTRAYECFPHDPKNWPITRTLAQDTDFINIENFRTLH